MEPHALAFRSRLFSRPSLYAAALSVGIGGTGAAGQFTAGGAPEEAFVSLQAVNLAVQRTVLDNGIIVLLREDHSAPIVALQIWVGTGAMDEGRWLGAGLSHFVEHMIFKGTPTRPPGVITREINDVGGEINAYTSQDRTVFHCQLPSTHWRVGLDVLSDAVGNANFPEEEWQRERDVILREMAMNRDDPQRVAGNLLWQTAYRVHPYRVPIIGYEEVFSSMTRDDLVAFFHENYVPDNMLVVAVGDFNAVEMAQAIRERLGNLQRRARSAPLRPQEPPQLSPRFARKTGAYEIGRLHLAFHTVAIDHPDAPALDVLATIVGVGRSSRLVKTIKDEQRLAHEISAWSATLKDPGLFGISATFDPTNETALTQAIADEIARWQTAEFEAAELEKARRMVLMGELSGLQTMEGQAYSYASGEFYAGDPHFSERYLRAVAKVTAAQLREVACRYLIPENSTLVVLSPAASSQVAPEKAAGVAETLIQRMTLSNNVPLLVRVDHRLPLVHIAGALRGGLLAESPERSGQCELMASLLTRGTSRRSALEIAETIERLGAALTSFSGRNSFGLQAQCLKDDLPTVLELMSECLLDPAFPEDELEKQRAVQLAAIRQQYERPFFVAEQALRELLFPNHPYRWTSLGNEETLRTLQRNDLVNFHRAVVSASNFCLAIFGDISAEVARDLAEKYFARMPTDAPLRLALEEPTPRLPARSKKREPREQTIVLMGFPGVRLNDPRADALDVLDTALSGLSSDLATAVREQRGLAYFVGSYHMAGLAPGLFVLYAGTREDAAEEVLALMDAEIARVTREGLRADEIQRAREQRIASHKMDLQNNAHLAQVCALNELYGLGHDYALKTEGRLRALTAEQIRAAATSVFRADRRAISLVLPAERMAPEKEEQKP